jgi:hypothetical protein
MITGILLLLLVALLVVFAVDTAEKRRNYTK